MHLSLPHFSFVLFSPLFFFFLGREAELRRAKRENGRKELKLGFLNAFKTSIFISVVRLFWALNYGPRTWPQTLGENAKDMKIAKRKVKIYYFFIIT